MDALAPPHLRLVGPGERGCAQIARSCRAAAGDRVDAGGRVDAASAVVAARVLSGVPGAFGAETRGEEGGAAQERGVGGDRWQRPARCGAVLEEGAVAMQRHPELTCCGKRGGERSAHGRSPDQSALGVEHSAELLRERRRLSLPDLGEWRVIRLARAALRPGDLLCMACNY